jgi:hypothetical protein
VSTPADSPRTALDVALRHGLPYTGLRDFEPDARLFHYVPLPFASQHRIVPMLVVGDTLKVASATPNPDLSLLKTRFPYLGVDIVIAPGPEIDRVLERAQRTS